MRLQTTALPMVLSIYYGLALGHFTFHECHGRHCSTSLEQRADYKRPSEFDAEIAFAKGSKPVETYFNCGERVIARMKNPPNSEDIHHNSLAKLRELGTVTDNEENLGAETISELKSPTLQLNIDLRQKWRRVKWTINAGASTISDTYFSPISYALISSTSNNIPLARLPGITQATLPYHSELWTTTYLPEISAGGIHYIVRLNIANTDTNRIFRAARRLLNSKAADTDVIVANINSDDVTERESFIALAGTDNGSSVFRMVADSHVLFRGRAVVRVYTWGKDRGQNEETDFNLPVMAWEMGEMGGTVGAKL